MIGILTIACAVSLVAVVILALNAAKANDRIDKLEQKQTEYGS